MMHHTLPTQHDTFARAEIDHLLELVGADRATPISRGFLVGLALLAGVDGLHAFVDEVIGDGRALDDIVAEIHGNWVRRLETQDGLSDRNNEARASCSRD